MNNNLKNLYFIHANGFLPYAYSSLFKKLNSTFSINNYLLNNAITNDNMKLKNWLPFHDDFVNTLKLNKKRIVGMGHSIGGNIILRSALTHPQFFKSLILLDPTLFVPRIIYFWKLSCFFNIQDRFHPWLKSTLNRKMFYDNFDNMFRIYRKKSVFSKMSDSNLRYYIKSITESSNNKLQIIYSKNIEYEIYRSGLIIDNYIWRNLKKINIPVLIIRAEYSNAFLKNAANKVNKITRNNVQIITLRDTTHLFPFEVPEKTGDIILDFVKHF